MRTKFKHDRPSAFRDIADDFGGLCVLHVRTCGIIPHLTNANPKLLSIYLRTKFEHDRPSRCRVTEGSEIVLWGMHVGRAHVRVHTTSDSCKTLRCRVSRYIPNLGTVGPVVAALQQGDYFRHPLNLHVSRAVVITCIGRHWSHSW